MHNSKDVFSWNYTNMNTCKKIRIYYLKYTLF